MPRHQTPAGPAACTWSDEELFGCMESPSFEGRRVGQYAMVVSLLLIRSFFSAPKACPFIRINRALVTGKYVAFIRIRLIYCNRFTKRYAVLCSRLIHTGVCFKFNLTVCW